MRWAESGPRFFSLSWFLNVEEACLCKWGRKESTQTPPAAFCQPFLGRLPFDLLLPWPFLRGFKAPSSSQVGPQPHSQEGQCGITALANPLPKGARRGDGRLQALVCASASTQSDTIRKRVLRSQLSLSPRRLLRVADSRPRSSSRLQFGEGAGPRKLFCFLIYLGIVGTQYFTSCNSSQGTIQ